MKPQEQLDLVIIKSIELLKVLYGENLGQLPDEHKLGYASTILHIHRQLSKESTTNVNNARSPVQSTLTKPLVNRCNEYYDPGLLLSPEEIAEQLFGVHLTDADIRSLSKLVVDMWRKKYGYSSIMRPCRNNHMCSYLYSSIDWDLVRQALYRIGITVE